MPPNAWARLLQARQRPDRGDDPYLRACGGQLLPNERSDMVIIRQKVSRAANGNWQMAGQQMTNDMLFASSCDKAGKGGLGSNLGFGKMKPTALSLSPSANFRRQFLEVLSHKCRRITNPSDVD